ncbi:GNAT family N-acetyltransferase [Paenibacillus sacheonensis]|uniref:GNAT family N-acetyltransferase n=1 Tax=Paenibacillus sacheonensis TaxID=742054 RepID=A0A7X4YSF3_9BACL|nr:GNAT family N-acetyltransferase [Paenibacillus sacheonensis]MBM7569268.1 RimJ/RimL family protein N-acetyltransferase [Paenibacillus sacheonensis]NBC71722.1 GNAT family N-acetyltransferase [Paenibacillus sacheonensis]
MDPLLLDIPTQFETERLLIRLPRPGDGRVVHAAIQASINELRPWLPFAQQDQTEEDVESNLRLAYAKFIQREDMRLLIFNKADGSFIGSAGLHNPNWDVRKFEIGYWIDTRHSGKGYMTEAVEGITVFAFTELLARRVEIRMDALNERSQAIPMRLGFWHEGTLRNDDMSADGTRVRDTYIYAMIP